MINPSSPQDSVLSLRTGTRIKDNGVSRVLYYSSRAVALLFHHRVVTLLNRKGVLLPSSIIVDVDTFPHISGGYFHENQLILDTIKIQLRNPVDLSYHEKVKLDSHRILTAIHPFLNLKDHSISTALLRLENEKIPLVGFESRVSDKQFEILRKSCSTADAVRNLLGLGFGLTPSGDDFALGVISIFNLTGRNTSDLKHALEDYDFPLSRTMLSDALDGYYPEPVHTLLKSISDKSTNQSLFNTVFDMGHSSGSDILAGMYYALKNPDN